MYIYVLVATYHNDSLILVTSITFAQLLLNNVRRFENNAYTPRVFGFFYYLREIYLNEKTKDNFAEKILKRRTAITWTSTDVDSTFS